ncbi:class I SAM-dependent methyltransferase [Aeromicrobium alkaliterrae]|uniref:Class I SAM-dependent methyltransferase n=1 Tax=Aeromicrobium alkaliterrae TaxID=302168 RepID=A0ABN2K2X5_9ACTN
MVDHDDASARMAKWLAGDRLACVLHLGDGTIAYHLADQGHEVVVAGDDVRSRRHRDVLYVRASGDRLPFAESSFDAVVAPHLSEAPTALADIARVLRPGGVVSTIERSHDDSLPWVRRLREIVGEPGHAERPAIDSLGGTGLFGEIESTDLAQWQTLDLAGLLRLASEIGRQPVSEATLARVKDAFSEVTPHTGHLRLRHRTRCLRATVLKTDEPSAPPPAETLLFDLR